jgi:hypothetical protein
MYLMGILVLELNCVSLIPKTAKLVGQFSTWWFFFRLCGEINQGIDVDLIECTVFLASCQS